MSINRHDDHSLRYQRIFDENFHRLIFHALRFVDDRAEAEDIVADVFFELWHNIDSIDLDSGITAYLYRAVTTRALNVLRHKNIAAVRIEILESINERRLEFLSDEDVQKNAENADITAGIKAAVDELPERCREIFVLSYVNGLKNKEIANAMNISVRTVEAQIYKALHVLRAKLKYLLLIIFLFLRRGISDL